MSFPGNLTDDPNDPTQGGGEGHDPSLYDIDHAAVDQAMAQSAVQADDAGGASASDKKNMLDAAAAVNATAGQPNPGDIAAMQGPSGGAGPNTINRLDATGPSVLPGADRVVSTTPGITSAASGLPGGGGAGTGGSGQLSEADWDKRFQGDMGYFNPQYESRAAFLDEAQRGDSAIRGQQAGGPHIDELAKMAQYDSDAKRILDSIQNSPDFYHAQNAANWAGQHNADLANQFGQAQGVSSQQAGGQGFNGKLGAPSQPAPQGANGAWLRGQLVNDVTNPIDNAHALMSDQMRKGIADALDSLGATGIHQNVDSRGNVTLDWTSASGKPMSLTESLVNYADALEKLKQQAAQQTPAAPPPSGGGGGYQPRAPRGGGGGFAPRGGGGGGGTDQSFAGQVAGDQGAPSYQTENYYQRTNPPLAADYMASPSFDNSNLQQAGATVAAYQPPTGFIPKRGQPY